jgi:hypothetical protein
MTKMKLTIEDPRWYLKIDLTLTKTMLISWLTLLVKTELKV